MSWFLAFKPILWCFFFTLLIVHFFVGLVTRQLHLSEFALVLISYISLKLCIFVLLEH